MMAMTDLAWALNGEQSFIQFFSLAPLTISGAVSKKSRLLPDFTTEAITQNFLASGRFLDEKLT